MEKLIFRSSKYGLDVYVDQSRELWIIDLKEANRRGEFEKLESMLQYLLDFYMKRNSPFVRELGNLSVELGEVYSLIYRIAKSNFIGWRENEAK